MRPLHLALFAVLTASLAGCAPHPGQSSGQNAAQSRVAAGDVATASSTVRHVHAPAAADAAARPALEIVATDQGAAWTGVTVSHAGRIFVNYPRWGDKVEFTVAELKSGKPVPYPNADINQFDSNNPAGHLVSVQSVVVGPDDRLWILDTGSLRMRSPLPGGAKLVAVDLNTNQLVKSIVFPPDVALPTTYLNDVRFNLRQGNAGTAYITDSGDQGPNGIIVVDLASDKGWRRLNGHPSVRAQPGFVATVESNPFRLRPSPGVSKPITVGTDGIAISADGKTLFYCPMSSRHLYGVSTDALADTSVSDEDVAKTVVDYGDRGYASDGLESDAAGRLYLTDYEHNAIHRRTFGPAGPADVTDEIIAQGPNLVWPDTLSLAADGYLYFTANQLCRQKQYHEGMDLRQKPYLLLRVKTDSQPVELK
jgi:sugar lactone lactonase YvrE